MRTTAIAVLLTRKNLGPPAEQFNHRGRRSCKYGSSQPRILRPERTGHRAATSIGGLRQLLLEFLVEVLRTRGLDGGEHASFVLLSGVGGG